MATIGVPSHTARRAREQFLSNGNGGLGGRLRAQIATSWHRSRLSGAPTSIRHPRYEPEINPDHRLIRAAQPLLDELADEIDGEKFCVFLGDAHAHILDRRVGEWMLQDQLDAVYAAQGFVYDEVNVGTNGMGTAVEDGREVQVLGAEHYAEELAEFTCVAVPIHNPFKGHVEGAIDLTCPVAATSRLMLPLVRDAAKGVEQRLYEQATTTERFLLQQFMQRSKRTSHAVVALNESLMLSNSRARRLLNLTDQHALWDHAAETMRSKQPSDRELTLAHGDRVLVRCEPLLDGGDTLGALLTIKTSPPRPAVPAVTHPTDHQALPSLVGQAPAWVRATSAAQRHLRDHTSLLLVGEAGVGKLAVARALHVDLATPAPFIVCEASQLVAVPESVTEQLSDGGTLLIRHLENLDAESLRMLRGLTDPWTRVPNTVLMATRTVGVPDLDRQRHEHREAAISALGFAAVDVPPLRDRHQDVPALMQALLSATGRAGYRFTPEATQLVARVELPGNVTELRTIVERSVASARGWTIEENDLPDDVRARAARRRLTPYEQSELHALLHALRETTGNKKQAAKMLGVSRSTLYRKMRSYGVGAQHLAC